MIRRRVAARPGARVRPFATASDAMPAPGPKDGHMSRSSRDLSKGIAVKSNGFKHGGGSTEGWGTKNTGRRLGKGQGARDVAARARLKEVLLRRAEEAVEGGPSAGKKRRRGVGGTTGDDARGKRARDEAAVAPVPRDAPDASRPVDPPEASDAPLASHPAPETSLADGGYTCVTCGVRCGTKANYDAHCDGKKHRSAKQRERGKAMLAAIKAGKRAAAAAE